MSGVLRTIVVAVLVAWPAAALAQRSLQARRIDPGSVRADGRLDEPAWSEAEVGGGFVERTPRVGATPPVETEVRVLHDGEAVYVAVTMAMPPGEAPRALELTRDDYRVWDDDAITLKFDVQRDRRSTVGFAVNSAGAQLDFVALENGRTMRFEYDAAWECGTSVGPDRWIAEFRLPFVALGLSPAPRGRIVGFAVSRDHAARRATYDWVLLPPEFGAMSARHYGALRGLDDVATGVPIAIVPFVLGTAQERVDRFRFESRAGGDLRLRLGQDLWTEVTVLTDFAQTDIDDQIVNLNRFPLFLPEKRAFFIAGLDAFDFGHPAHSDAQVFFSRRIGLDAHGDEVPILAGLKQYGHAGPLTIGLLDVLTLDTEETPAVNWTVARMSASVTRGIEVGAIGTLRSDVPELGTAHVAGTERPLDWTGGLDGAFSEGRLEGQAMVATTGRAEDDGHGGTATRATLTWRGEEVQPELVGLFVTDGFDPAVGFVRRRGVAAMRLSLPWTLRAPTPTIDSIVVQAVALLESNDELDLVLGRAIHPEIGLTLRSGWWLYSGFDFEEDLVEEAFEVVPDVIVPAGRYRGANVWVAGGSPASRTPSAELILATGTVAFGGSFRKVETTLAWAPSRHLRMSANGQVTFVTVPYARDFAAATVNARATLALSTDLFADVLSGLDNIAETAVVYVRLRWRWRPGSDVFLVYREDSTIARPFLRERLLALKVSLRMDAMLGR